MPMVSKVTATDRGSVSGMAGAGHDRGLSGGRGSRRWVSVLLRAVTAGAVALGAVLSVAPSAAAEEGLDVESQNRYVVEDAGVRATTTLTIRNTSPDQYLTDSVLSFYWDEFGIPVPAGTQNVQATSEGAPLQVQIEPTEDPSTAIAVASFRPLNYGQSQTIEWRYTIPGAPFRAADWTRVGPGFATFAAQGIGDPGSVGVVVVMPASMTFHSTGSFAERREGDAVTYTATENTDEYGIWAAISARDPERADERAVEFGDSTLQLVSLPGDVAWTDFAAERVTAGLPVLEDIIGVPWPGGMDKIREDVSPHVLGHVWFDHTADEIVVAEDLDEATLFHELTHAWLNPDRLQERWLYEGLTEVVAYRAVEALGGTSDPWPAPDRAAPSALALNAWKEPTGKPDTAVDDYAYAAASNAVGQMVGGLDDDTFTALVVATYAGESAYELVGSVEENTGRTDWQRFLDLVETRTGNADAAQVYRTWVVDADQAALLDERATARRAYTHVDAGDGDWLPPLGLRSAMTDWEFTGAGDVVAGIGTAPADAAAVQEAADPVLLVAALGLAACGSDSESPAAEESLPPVADGYQHPTGADAVVVEYAEVGGFLPRELAFQQPPNVLVSGDGQVVGPGAQIAIYPGPLLPAVQVQPITEAGIQAVLAAADEAGLLRQVEYEQPTNIADASTATVTINVNGETYVHEAYALGLSLPGEPGGETTPERQALADFIADLNDLAGLVGTEQLGEQTIYEPAEYGIEALPVDDLSAYGSDGIDPTVVDWPAGASVQLVDASTCTVVTATEVGEAFAAANQLTFFDDGGTVYQVLVKPILPGTTCG